MHISFVDIQNYRRLKNVRIDLSNTQTLFVGANNSGKTSAMDALISFLSDKCAIQTIDFTITNWTIINKIGEDWESLTEEDEDRQIDIDRWREVLPTLDLWFEVDESEFHRVSHFIPALSWRGGKVGLRLSFEPNDIQALQSVYLEQVSARKNTLAAAPDPEKYNGMNLWPKSLQEFLDRRLDTYFKIKFYTLDPKALMDKEGRMLPPQVIGTNQQPIEQNPLHGLVKVSPINAQRGFSDAKSTESGANEGHGKKLSKQLADYYRKHLNPEDTPSPADLDALHKLHTAQELHDELLQESFLAVTQELNSLGYPGVDNPSVVLRTLINPVDTIHHDTAVQYQLPTSGGETYSLPETYNGLGYQNLIYMFFKLKKFRDDWMKVGKANSKQSGEDATFEPIHLVLIEEPEAHLHAQVQQVFIKEAYKLLTNHPHLKKFKALHTQLVVSTHSTHIAHETEFKDLRYFRRVSAAKSAISIPTSIVENMTEVFGSKDETAKFVTRYLKATHSDLFFADGAILVEGAAERMLLPRLINVSYENLRQKYISILEIHGAHAHRLRPLIEKMQLTTLIITDLDATQKNEGDKWSSCAPAMNTNQETNNDTLKSWHPSIKSIDELLALESDKKTLHAAGAPMVRVAYQTPINIQMPKLKGETIPNTFEDALVYTNAASLLAAEEKGFFAKARRILEGATTIPNLHAEMHKAIKGMDKGKFALDLLFAELGRDIQAPDYIAEGLKWLLDTLTPVQTAKPKDTKAQEVA